MLHLCKWVCIWVLLLLEKSTLFSFHLDRDNLFWFITVPKSSQVACFYFLPLSCIPIYKSLYPLSLSLSLSLCLFMPTRVWHSYSATVTEAKMQKLMNWWYLRMNNWISGNHNNHDSCFHYNCSICTASRASYDMLTRGKERARDDDDGDEDDEEIRIKG